MQVHFSSIKNRCRAGLRYEYLLACLLVSRAGNLLVTCLLACCLIYVFDTVPERRRAAGAAREEEVEGAEGAEGAISRHCGAVKGERE